MTRNGNEIHSYLNELYINGKLDADVINILVRRQILYLWKGNNQIHIDLLLPMCCILIKWDHSISNNTNYPTTVTFNGQTYNPLELVQYVDLPSLDEFSEFNEKKRKSFVLRCVDLALGLNNGFNWHGIHTDYKLWFCLLKLWWHTKTEHSNALKMTLLAMIISFLKQALLDTYGEISGKYSNIDIRIENHFFNLYFRKISNTRNTTRKTISTIFS